MGIRPVYIGVTLGAPACSPEMVRGPLVDMTLLAYAVRKHQEVVGIASVRIMARKAAVPSRSGRNIVIVDERTLFIRVTSEAQGIAFIIQL